QDDGVLSGDHADGQRPAKHYAIRLRDHCGDYGCRPDHFADALSGSGFTGALVPVLAARAEDAQPHRRDLHGRRCGRDCRPALGRVADHTGLDFYTQFDLKFGTSFPWCDYLSNKSARILAHGTLSVAVAAKKAQFRAKASSMTKPETSIKAPGR